MMIATATAVEWRRSLSLVSKSGVILKPRYWTVSPQFSCMTSPGWQGPSRFASLERAISLIPGTPS